jgi:hypothetical protein
MIAERRSAAALSLASKTTCKGRSLGDGFAYAYPEAVFTSSAHFYSTREEEYTPNRGIHGRGFKDFEHYLAFRPETTGTGAPFPFTGRIFEYEPHLYDGSNSSNRYGAFGYDSGGNEVRPFGEPGLPLEGLPSYRVYRPDGGFVPPPRDINSLNDRACLAIFPRIKADLSILNSVYELKDMKSVPNTLHNIWNLMRGSKIRNVFQTLKQQLQGTSDGYLQAQFNLLPLLSDIAGIQQAIHRTKDKIDRILRDAQTNRVGHWSTDIDEYPDITDSSVAYYPLKQPDEMSSAFIQYTAAYLSRQVVNEPSRFHAEMAYRYTLSAYEVENAQLLGLLDAIGVNLNPRIIWNAIPWSFVIDWVLGVGRYLEDHGTTLNLDPLVIIRGYMWSLRRRRVVYTQRNAVSILPSSNALNTSIAMPAVNESSYRRHLEDWSSNSLTASGLSLTEISLGAALLVPRKWKAPRRPPWSK